MELNPFKNKLAVFAARSWIKLAGLPSGEASPPLAHDVKSIVVFQLGELGSVIMASSFLADLRSVYPQATITLVVKSSAVAAIDACPYVNHVVSYDTPGPRASWFAQLVSPIRFGRKLAKAGGSDLSINLRWDKDAAHAAVMAVFAKARHRVAFSENVYAEKAREYKGFDSLSTLTVSCEPTVHEVEKGRVLLEAIAGPIQTPIAPLEFWSAGNSAKLAAIAIANLGVGLDEPYITVCPSAGRSRLKAWPTPRFIKLIQELRSRYKSPVVLVGSADDAPIADEILAAVADHGVTSLCGKTTIGESAEVVRGAKLFIGCDSGLSHIAAAVGTPQITLFGSSCSHRFHPWSPVAQTVVVELPCGPCAPPHTRDRCVNCIYPTPRCMETISVADVLHQLAFPSQATSI